MKYNCCCTRLFSVISLPDHSPMPFLFFRIRWAKLSHFASKSDDSDHRILKSDFVLSDFTTTRYIGRPILFFRSKNNNLKLGIGSHKNQSDRCTTRKEHEQSKKCPKGHDGVKKNSKKKTVYEYCKTRGKRSHTITHTKKKPHYNPYKNKKQKEEQNSTVGEARTTDLRAESDALRVSAEISGDAKKKSPRGMMMFHPRKKRSPRN